MEAGSIVESKNVEIHTTSAVPIQGRENWISSAKKTLGARQETKDWPKEVEIDLTKDRVYGEVVNLVTTDLKRRYSQAGVEIQDSDFPKIILLKQGWIQKFSSEVRNFGRSGDMKNQAVYEVSEGEDLLLDMVYIHHETDHELGKEFAIVDEEGDITNPRLGYIHATGKEQKSHLQSNVYTNERGRVLEEGVVQYGAVEFVLNSNDELCIKAREEFAQKVKAKLELSNTDDQRSIRDLCISGIEENNPNQKYNRLLVESLILGAKRIDPEEGNRMEQDLLKTRVKTTNMRSLMDRVDKIFGNGVFSEIIKLNPRNTQETKEYVNKLRKIAGLQEL